MSKIEDMVCSDIQQRADMGLKKYGTTMDRTDLTEIQWLQHAYEEALDLAVYLKKLITETEMLLQHAYEEALDLAVYLKRLINDKA